MASGSKSDDDEDDEDEYDIFESSMESLFGQHQAASGKPGQKCKLDLGNGAVLHYKIPFHQDDSNTRLYAHFQWDAGVHLAMMLHRQCQPELDLVDDKLQVQDRAVLELGSGSGLPALTSALAGAKQVVITDYPDEGILKTIRENIRLCNVGRNTIARGLDWTDVAQVKSILQESSQAQGYDLILCADTLWLSDFHAPLLETICQLLKKSSASRVILLSGFHTGRRALIAFYNRAIKVGLCTDSEQRHKGILEYNAVTRTSRPWSSSIPFPTRDQQSEDEYSQHVDNMDDYTERTKWLLHVTLRWADL